MARKKRVYDDDDGRTVADMSGVERPNLFGFRMPPSLQEARSGRAQEAPPSDRPWESTELSPAERRAVIWGAMGAGALIALTFILAAAAVILLILHFS